MIDRSAQITAIEPFVKYKINSGDEIKIPVKVTISTILQIQVKPSDSIANIKKRKNYGTVGCIVEDEHKQLCILTCFHSVIDPGNEDYI